jgi:hypothetical protein
MICNRLSPGCSTTLDSQVINNACPDIYGCPPDVCPDFTIRRHDTLPSFKVAVEDCDGPLDLEDEDIIVEANMWFNAKLKVAIDESETTLSFADNIGFYQVLPNDIIIMDRIRTPEYMLVVSIDEDSKTIEVQRSYNGVSSTWAKGNAMKIFRFINNPAAIEMLKEDITSPDGTTQHDVLTDTFLVYDWTSLDTCAPGCYYLEFKVFKQLLEEEEEISVIPYCVQPPGIEWIRRFPVAAEGFLVKIINTQNTL